MQYEGDHINNVVQRSTWKNFEKKNSVRSSHCEFFGNIVVPKATVLEVLEKFCKIYGKSSELESLLKIDFSTGIFLKILRNFQKHIFYRTNPSDCLCCSEVRILNPCKIFIR